MDLGILSNGSFPPISKEFLEKYECPFFYIKKKSFFERSSQILKNKQIE